ncbi:MAG: ImmA/IrrE family metallo-endopeptidase [Patescibacteria group bacterium]|nr:ImmA/IrrE family metallo-endopeptidase [Patescibacteria group bacterium]
MKSKIQFPQKLARRIISELQINNPPIGIKEVIQHISRKRKIIIELVSHSFINKVSGAHISKNKKHVIAYNRDHHPHRQRFTIAHELGHLILGHADLRNNGDDFNSKNPEETAVNKFAAELLVPIDFLKRDFAEGIKDVKSLAQRYKVSEEMMWWRIMDTELFKKI